ncbi:hypothetical protein PtrSN002B_012094, partial [Pyrenophora tritici-repentis]
MAMLDMPEMKGGQVQEEFLVTANKLHETWATAELRKLLDLQENPAVKDLDLPTINTLVASFRQFLRIIKPQGSTFGTFGASLGIADSSGSTKANTTEEGPSQNQKPQAKHNHPPGKCICLEEHWYSNCPYINPAVRRAGWTLDPEIEAKFKKAKKNPRIAKQLQRAAERQNAKATSEPTTTPIAFDAQAYGDHQPHSMACSFQAFSTNHVSNPPYINRWIMDPGSNVHVINSKSWRWTHTRYSTADEALYAGSQSVSISEWGNVIIPVRTPNGLGRDFAAACKSIGIKIETTAENTDEQKGLQEAAGRTIMQRTRALRISSGLPKDLTNELAVAA